MSKEINQTTSAIELPPALLDKLRGLIIEARRQVLQRVDTIQVNLTQEVLNDGSDS